MTGSNYSAIMRDKRTKTSLSFNTIEPNDNLNRATLKQTQKRAQNAPGKITIVLQTLVNQADRIIIYCFFINKLI